MNKCKFETPILFLIFNRPNLTETVFKKITELKPKHLFIAADGPREGNYLDVQKCHETRKKVLDMINWNCEVKKLFRNENLGCGLAVSQAITWFFKHVDSGIILEDDCYPKIEFFHFCKIMLERYSNESQVMHIAGYNYILTKNKYSDYFFSKYSASIWGWATWRRAWKNYDYELNNLERTIKSGKLKDVLFYDKVVNRYISLLLKCKNKEIDTWDYQWLHTMWSMDGLSIIPNISLVKNLGVGEFATHTHTSNIINFSVQYQKSFRISEIRHPKIVNHSIKSDKIRILKKHKDLLPISRILSFLKV